MAEVGNLNASLSLDISEFGNGVKEAASMLQSLGNALSSALGNSTQGFSSITRSITEVREQVSSLKAEVKSLQAEFNQAATPEAFTQMQQHTSRLRDELAQAASSATQLTSAAGGANNAVGGLNAEAKDTYTLVNNTTGEMIDLKGATQAAGKAAASMAKNVDRIAKSVDKANKAAAKSTTTASQASKGTQKVAADTNQVNKNLQQSNTLGKDLKRIIGGIVISQAFYELLGIMNQLVRGAAKFASNMEQSQIAFKYLLSDASQAEAMINTLQDFAIHSPLDTTGVMDSTRQLMAMGFQANEVVPTLQVLADTAAVFTSEAGGMSDMIAHITLALGQMRSSGKVMTQELRQLYNAGIPVFQILQEELKLTAAEVRNIGKLGIDSEIAVAALLSGLQKRYSGAAEEFTQTITGAFEVIEDSWYVLSAIMAAGPRESFGTWINEIARTMEALVIITRNYGLGGLMQALFPPELHEAIRRVVGSLQQLGSAFAAVGRIARDIFGNAMAFIVQVISWVGPPIATLINALAQFIQWVYVTIPGVRQLVGALAGLLVVVVVARAFQGLWRVLRLGKILGWLIDGVVKFARALYSLAAAAITAAASNWKLFAALAAVVAILAIIISSSQRARDSLGRVADAFKSLGVGFSTSDILQPEFDPPPQLDLDGLGGGLDDLTDSVDDLGDSADKTRKKLEKMFNQSFDEVFLIDDRDALGGADGGAGVGDMDLSNFLADLEKLNSQLDNLAMSGDFWDDWGNIQDAFDIGGGLDFAEELSQLGQDFWEALVEAFAAPEWVGASLGGLIGAVIGGLFGHPLLGAAIGSLVGWLAGLYWDDLIEAFEQVGINETGALAGAIAVPLGLAIGAKVGGAAGGAIGAGIGLLVAWLINEIAEGLETGDWTGVGKPIGVGLGWAIGALVGGPVIGAGIGLLVGWIADLITQGITTGEWDFAGLGLSVGGGIGAAIGFVAGGPAGAAIGAAIGSLVGWIGSLIVDNWDAIGEFFSGIGDWFVEKFSNLGEAIEPIKASIGEFFSGIWETITEWLATTWESITEFFGSIAEEITGFFEGIWTAITEFFAPITEALSDLGDTIGGILGDIKDAIVTVGQDIYDAVSTVLGDIWEVVQEIFSFIFDLVAKIVGDIWETITTFFSDIWDSLSTWISDIWDKFTSWISDIWDRLVEWLGEIWDKFTTWFMDTFGEVIDFFADILGGIVDFFADIWDKVVNFFSDIWNKLVEWISDLWDKIVGFFSDIGNAIVDFIAGVINGFTDFLSGLWTNIKDGVSNIYNTFKDWISNLWDNVFGKFFDWISDGIDKLREFFGLESKASKTTIPASASSNVSASLSSGSGSSRSMSPMTTGAQFSGLTSASFDTPTGTPGPTSLGKTTPMNGLPIDGHRDGGIFNKEHVAWISEDDDTEAIIPLNNPTAMQPFVDSVSQGVIEYLAPMIGNQEGADNRQPLYVGTLIADERGLRELERKMRIITDQEDGRGG